MASERVEEFKHETQMSPSDRPTDHIMQKSVGIDGSTLAAQEMLPKNRKVIGKILDIAGLTQLMTSNVLLSHT